MNSANLSGKTFLVVDDVRVTRITMIKTLKNCGEPAVYNAANGHEAISILQDDVLHVDCVLADFNMPVMHGLQLVKAIRTGEHGIRRNTPVIMITGHGDRNLLGIAMALDVNGFLLKPVQKSILVARMQRVMQETEESEGWIKPSESYSCIDVHSSVKSLLLKPTLEQEDRNVNQINSAIERTREKQRVDIKMRSSVKRNDLIADAPIETYDGNLAVKLKNVLVGSVLAKDVVGSRGVKLVSAGAVLTLSMLSRLKDMVELGEPIDEVIIENPQKKTKK
ncbi:MAG: response regulator [bacterium]|nr:response regulator [bacterium]